MDFIKEVVAAIGSALSVIFILLAIFRGVINKWIETTIEKTAEKSLAKYSNILERRTKAYEMLLEKEFKFFESASNFVSELVVDIQDFSYYLGIDDEHPAQPNLEKAKEVALRILKRIPEFKRDSLLSEAYLSEDVRLASVKIIHDIQEAAPLMYDAMKMSVDDVLDADAIKKITEVEKVTLMNCALLSTRIKFRLVELSKE